MLRLGMWRRRAAGGGRGEGEGARDTESKTRTPHKDVGKNLAIFSGVDRPNDKRIKELMVRTRGSK